MCGGTQPGKPRCISPASRRVMLLLRGAASASSMSYYLIRQLDAAPNIDVRFHTQVIDGSVAAPEVQ